MSESSIRRSDDFLRISDQFQLGELTTEASHTVTANLSDVARHDVAAALAQLFEVDRDVLRKYHEFAQSGQAATIRKAVLKALSMMKTLVFIGFGTGLGDPNFGQLLAWTGRVFAGSEYRRFRLARFLATSARPGPQEHTAASGLRGPRLRRHGGRRFRAHQGS